MIHGEERRFSRCAPPGHPARGSKNASRQVSWLAGHCFCQPSQCLGTSGKFGRSSLLTVAGAAPESRQVTGFPLSFRTRRARKTVTTRY